MKTTKQLYLLLFFQLLIFNSNAIEIKRLNNDQPIIDKSLFEKNGIATDGDNINGPCVVRLPDWLPVEKRTDPKAKYYLYFGHHHGAYIRMAWAESITGKWRLYSADKQTHPSKRGVLSLYNEKGEKKIYPGNNIEISSHIASPMVVIDNEKKQFALFFHGQTKLISEQKNDQRTFVSYSSDGLNFQQKISPVMLGGSYFATFSYKNNWYAFSNGGALNIAPAGNSFDTYPKDFNFGDKLWKGRPNFFNKVEAEKNIPDFRVRHLSTYLENDVLYIFLSTSHDCPEQIYFTKCLLNGNNKTWTPESLQPVFKASEAWEGGKIKPEMSDGGAAKEFLNEVRDPYIFKDSDGQFYMFYCAGGECAIGIAQVKNFVEK